MPNQSQPLPGWPRGLRAELAAAYIGVGESTFHKLAKDAGFPQPVYLTGRLPVWLRDDLDRLLDGKAGRDASSPAASNPWTD